MFEEHDAILNVATLVLRFCDGTDLYRRHEKLSFDTRYGLEERN